MRFSQSDDTELIALLDLIRRNRNDKDDALKAKSVLLSDLECHVQIISQVTLGTGLTNFLYIKLLLEQELLSSRLYFALQSFKLIPIIAILPSTRQRNSKSSNSFVNGCSTILGFPIQNNGIYDGNLICD